MKQAILWKLEKTLKSEHRIFSTREDDRLAIADKSGYNPNETEDGILWIDHGRKATGQLSNGRPYISVPVIKERSTENLWVMVEVEDIPDLIELGIAIDPCALGQTIEKWQAIIQALALRS